MSNIENKYYKTGVNLIGRQLIDPELTHSNRGLTGAGLNTIVKTAEGSFVRQAKTSTPFFDQFIPTAYLETDDVIIGDTVWRMPMGLINQNLDAGQLLPGGKIKTGKKIEPDTVEFEQFMKEVRQDAQRRDERLAELMRQIEKILSKTRN